MTGKIAKINEQINDVLDEIGKAISSDQYSLQYKKDLSEIAKTLISIRISLVEFITNYD